MLRKSGKKLRTVMINTSMIKPPADDYSAVCDEDKLCKLTESIRQSGIIQPVVVTKQSLELRYSLVAGRRRLMAAKRLGLKTVPAIIAPPEKTIYIRLLENMYREPPSCFETAKLISVLIEELKLDDYRAVSLRLGMPEDDIREKLKLLSLGDEQTRICRAAGVTQDAANRILAMPKSERDKLFFGLLNPGGDIESCAWQLRDRLGLDSDVPRLAVTVKDVRIFFNTVENAIYLMKQAGVEASSERYDYGGMIEYIVRIPSSNTQTKPHASVLI